MVDERLVAFTARRAAEVAELSSDRLRYWDRTGLIRPSVRETLSEHRTVRLYYFPEVMSLLVASELRRRRVSLQHIRQIVAYLQNLGYPEPLRQITFATEGRSLFFQLEDGSWSGSRLTSQTIIPETLNLEPLRARIRRSTDRDPALSGQIEQRRGAMGGKPLIAGTRIPVAAVQRYLQRGTPTEEILQAYPQLLPADVDAVASLSA